jgi:antitoxin MazE
VPQVTIGKWGNNLALRLPGEVAATSGMSDGDLVDMFAVADEIVIRRAAPKFTLAQLFAGKTAEEWRALYAGAYDWGPDVGREIIED